MKIFTHYSSKLSLIALASSLLFACSNQDKALQQNTNLNLPAGVSLIENVVASEDRLAIPFKKYTLANGLTVILHQDNSDPLVHVDVTYHVVQPESNWGNQVLLIFLNI